MQNIVIEKPYRFVPPHRGNWWPSLIQRLRLVDRYLRKREGVVAYECRGLEHLRASLDAGHGILLTPNHCRPADPLSMGFLMRAVRRHPFGMASWHLFNQDRFTRWALPKIGAFSVNREGIDRKAIDLAIEVLSTAERPLVIFPEGAVSRTNDRLHALLDGVAFIARTAARRRTKRAADEKVVVHPVALKYRFEGDLKEALAPALADIEHRLSWHPQDDLPLLDRIAKVGVALLCLKEIEYFGQPRDGTLAGRLRRLIDRVLGPLEAEWLDGLQTGPVVPRVKALRMKILPDMVNNRVSEQERARRWRQLGDVYLSQQLACYLPEDLAEYPSVDRLMETVERYEEDLTDKVRVHGRMKVIIAVGEAIEVPARRERRAEVDPLMAQIESQLQAMLDGLARESPLYE